MIVDEKETRRRKYQSLMVLKKILFSYNFLLWASGCVGACIGIWFRINRDLTTLVQRMEDSNLSLTASKIYLGANLLISVGSLCLFIGLIGVLGSIRENEYILFLYSLLHIATFGLYMAAASWGFYSWNHLKGIVTDAMRELFNKALLEMDQGAKYAVNELQRQLQCCGNVGPAEYANDIPPSCSAYVIGCNQAFYDFYLRYVLILAWVAFCFALIQLIGLVLSINFGVEVRKARIIVERKNYGYN